MRWAREIIAIQEKSETDEEVKAPKPCFVERAQSVLDESDSHSAMPDVLYRDREAYIEAQQFVKTAFVLDRMRMLTPEESLQAHKSKRVSQAGRVFLEKWGHTYAEVGDKSFLVGFKP